MYAQGLKGLRARCALVEIRAGKDKPWYVTQFGKTVFILETLFYGSPSVSADSSESQLTKANWLQLFRD